MWAMIASVVTDLSLVLMTGPPGTGKSTLAEQAAGRLGACVLGWDWVMAALTPFEEIQDALHRSDHVQVRRVGWSILWNVAAAQLRNGRSVVLDGCARTPEIDATRQLAVDHDVRPLVVVTRCSDLDVHRSRVEGRARGIPGWHELDWDHVSDFLTRWTEPTTADLYVDATEALADNIIGLAALIDKSVSG
jgi:predicted kinase